MTTEQLHMVTAEQLSAARDASNSAKERVKTYLDAFDVEDIKDLLKSPEVPDKFKSKAKEAQEAIEAYESMHEAAKKAAIGDPELARSLLTSVDIRDIFNSKASGYGNMEAEYRTLLDKQAAERTAFLSEALMVIASDMGMDPKLLDGLAVPGEGPISVNGSLAVLPIVTSPEVNRIKVGWARGASREILEAAGGGAAMEDGEE